MITGFNTDIEYQGVTYHVQTEDKGTATPLILSLVYNGGTILASKRSPYDDLLLENFDEKVLAERLQRQHKLICAAISSGRIEDLKRMSIKPSAEKTPKVIFEKKESQKNIAPEEQKPEKIETTEGIKPEKQKAKKNSVPKLNIPEPQILKETSDMTEELSGEQGSIDLEQILAEERIEAEERFGLPIPKPNAKIWDTETKPEKKSEEIIVEAVEIIEDVEIISADAVAVIEDKTISQKFLEDLSRAQSAPKNRFAGGELTLRLLNDEEFYGGDEKNIRVLVFRGASENVLSGAHIMVKILGSGFSPSLYHAKTGGDGTAAVNVKIPVFDGGRAVLLIKAMNEGDETEFRRIVKMR